jgi:DNA phosphorothioation-dependent restriction protein DptG
MVPPTVEVRVGGPRGRPASLQLWIDNTIMLKEMKAKHLEPPDPVKWNRQLHRVYVFDDLVANTDENEGNLLFDREWNFVKIDHSRAFTDTLVQPYEVGKSLVQLDRQLFERVKRLDRDTVKREIGGLLETGALDALFRRRDAIVKGLEALAKKKGEAAVFVPSN